jgi:hypothetical protein
MYFVIPIFVNLKRRLGQVGLPVLGTQAWASSESAFVKPAFNESNWYCQFSIASYYSSQWAFCGPVLIISCIAARPGPSTTIFFFSHGRQCILFKFHQLHTGMCQWRGNRDYLLCLFFTNLQVYPSTWTTWTHWPSEIFEKVVLVL